MAGYLPLDEAAEYVTTRAGVHVTPAGLLRAGVHGVLLILAPFSGQMHNCTNNSNDDVLGLLEIPPRHLQEIETDGQTVIKGAFSLDGKTSYSPQMMRTHEQLRVLVSELDRTMNMWVSADIVPPATATSDAPEKGKHEDKAAMAVTVTDEPHLIACTKQEIIDGFLLTGKKWGDILGRPDREGKRFKGALVQAGRRGRQTGGVAAPTRWDPIVLARLLIELDELTPGKVKSRFIKTWPEFEAELLAEIGDI